MCTCPIKPHTPIDNNRPDHDHLEGMTILTRNSIMLPWLFKLYLKGKNVGAYPIVDTITEYDEKNVRECITCARSPIARREISII